MNPGDNMKYASMNAYISSLLDVGRHDVMSSVVLDPEEIDGAEDEFEDLLESVVSVPAPVCSGDTMKDNNYLSFDVAAFSYIIPLGHVVTVKHYSHYDVRNTGDVYTFDMHNNVISGRGHGQYLIMIRADHEYALQVDKINGVVAFAADQVRYKHPSRQRPWLSGITHDYQHILVNGLVLEHEFDSKSDQGLTGIKSAVSV